MAYTKYRLKPEAELAEIFKSCGHLYVLHCQKCYSEFEGEEEPECKKANLLAGMEQNKIAGCSRIDFLCNEKHLKDVICALEPRFSSFGVISCGIGIQAAADILPGREIIALADSIPHGKNATPGRIAHGISLDSPLCSACGQCFLDITGGICPVANCAKSLLNGPCGGASEGKCEVDREKNCAWEEIFNRLKKQGKRFSKAVEIRDYSLFGYSETKNSEEFNRGMRVESFYGGVRPLERKAETENAAIEKFPEPDYAAIFLHQHTGKPSRLLVKPGDTVKTGQIIGERDGFISSAVHASISGKVVSISEKFHPAFLRNLPAVIIENDGRSLSDDSIAPLKSHENAAPEAIIKHLEDKGIVGLGGAMFPSQVKLSPPKPVDVLLINGAECEPFLNADNRLMIEFPEEVLAGARIILRVLGASRAVIAVEENKPEAIEKLSALAGNGIQIVPLPSKYPQGSERMLIKSVLSRTIPDGGLPMDAGTAVFNAGTVYAVNNAVTRGIPLFERIITVSGEYPGKKGNFNVKIGTPMADILAHCGAEESFGSKIIKMGGPMMGIEQTSRETYVVKGTAGFTIMEKPEIIPSDERECIKCGRCVDACPMELYPLRYVYLAKNKQWEKLKDFKLSNCFECGACEYVCSAKISILNIIKKAKANAGVKN